MKKIELIIVLIFLNVTLLAQENSEKYLAKVQSLDSTLETLYGVISGEKGEERDWELFRYLFKPEAKLIPSVKNKEGNFEVKYMSPEDYIATSENGYLRMVFMKKKFTGKQILLVISHRFLVPMNLLKARPTPNLL